MKAIILLISLLTSISLFADGNITCSGKIISAAQTKALEGNVFSTLVNVSVSLKRVGNNMYMVTLNKGNKNVIYSVFSDYEEFYNKEVNKGRNCSVTKILFSDQ